MTRYRAADPATLLTVELPPFTALYDRRSGTTHLLTEPAPEILGALGTRPLSLAQLQAELAARFELAEVAALADRLEELAAVGLVTVE